MCWGYFNGLWWLGENVENKERTLCAEGTFRGDIIAELEQQQQKLML